MMLWLSVLAVTAANWVMKASGPLALGERRLPPRAVKVISLMASALLAGLIITNLGGAGWSDLNWQQVLGVGTAGLARAQGTHAARRWLWNSRNRTTTAPAHLTSDSWLYQIATNR